MTGWELGLGTVVAATMFGLVWRRRQGRVQVGFDAAAGLPEPVLCGLDRAAAVTLLLLTAPVCARCPQARALLSEVAATTPGIRHAELDLAMHPELAAELGVRSTPTTLVVSRTGHELFRVAGVPRRAELLSALQPHL
ncbi:MAG TPA: thioredoxin family protein [Pseudonocardiaceae bacterium]|jgi:thiol-disulfide isomerase/thioredoxin|nr:thioredoxin family protein [Pseudonocardiaceae bacterium]